MQCSFDEGNTYKMATFNYYLHIYFLGVHKLIQKKCLGIYQIHVLLTVVCSNLHHRSQIGWVLFGKYVEMLFSSTCHSIEGTMTNNSNLVVGKHLHADIVHIFCIW